ncbi:MFS transporter [Nocardia sp. 348MFTsu5.1]|uniref:MFS transporter n=1 Tax=Nocardia sp. 348MFTsu5.1 TaxID=1172185 RepID=UPI000360EFF7|nr:MFS transporter [Nocardia sp. 348MFTsu5.1]
MSIIDRPANSGSGAKEHRSGRRAWLGLAVLTLPVFLVSMDFSVLYLAIPTLSAELAPSAAEQLWIVDIYGFLIAGLLITMGNLGDRFGRRRLLLIGATLFGVASVLAAFAPDASALIAARAIMGIGGATLLPSSLSLIGNMFPDVVTRAKAIGVWTAAFAGGSALGPVIGGVLLHHFWWGSVFLINVPVLLVLLVLAPRLVPEYRSGITDPFDVLGIALSMLGILPLVYAIKHGAAEGLDTTTLTFAAIGIVGMWLFIRHERRTPFPLLELKLFGNARFSAAIGSALTGMMTLGALSYLTGIYLQSVLGRDVMTAALLGLPMAIAVAAFSMSASRIAAYVSVRWAFVLGMVFAAAGNAGMIFLGVDQGVGVYLVSSAIAGIGYGMIFSLVSDVAVSSVPVERSGAAVGISETSFELGTAFGLAILGSVATMVFRKNTEGSGAQETLSETLHHAQDLDPAAQSTLADTARDAFVDGLHVTATVNVALLAAMAVIVAVLLRTRTSVKQPAQ